MSDDNNQKNRGPRKGGSGGHGGGRDGGPRGGRPPGQCSKGEVQAWALNRFTYQAHIPGKD